MRTFFQLLLSALFIQTTFAVAPDCIFTAPLDGYSKFNPVVPPTQIVADTELRQSLDLIKAHIALEQQTPDSLKRRESSGEFKNSYCLFHSTDQKIIGTVLLFHGFSNRPEQMSKLASYLFHSGFNIYNVFLSKHYEAPGSKYWPKLLYRFDVMDSPEFKTMSPGFVQKVLGVYEHPDSPAFAEIFETAARTPDEQNDNGWLDDAKVRLGEIAPIPGPQFVVGLSLGSSVALNLGAESGGNRIKGIVAHAPYLQEHDPDRRTKIKLFGPAASQTANLNNQEFSAASPAAQQLLGKKLFIPSKLERLAGIPTFLIGTESDLSADTGLSYELHRQLAEKAPSVKHLWFSYSRDAGVGHAMTDPRDYPEPFLGAENGGGRNYRYKSLYQETAKFLAQGEIDTFNLQQFDQNPSLPQVQKIFANY